MGYGALFFFFLQKSGADNFGPELHNQSTSIFKDLLQSDLADRGINFKPVESASKFATGEGEDLSAQNQRLPRDDQLNDHELLSSEMEERSVETSSNSRTFDQLCLDADDVIERAEEVIQANQNCLVDDLCKIADDVIGRSESVVKEAEMYLAGDLVARAAARNEELLTQVSNTHLCDDVIGSEPRQAHQDEPTDVDRTDQTSDDDFYLPMVLQSSARSHNANDDDEISDDDDDDFHDCEDSLEVPPKTGQDPTGNADLVEEGTADSDSSSDVSGFYPSHAHVVAASPMASLPSRSVA